MQEALKMVDASEDGKQKSRARLVRYLGQKSLEPFIYKGKDLGHFEPILCYRGDKMATLFGRDKSTISRHIKNIFEEGELELSSVIAKFATTATDGKFIK